MKKLLKLNGFNSDMQYYEYVVKSYLNNDLPLARYLFEEMPRLNKKAFIKAAITNWESGLSSLTIGSFVDLI